MTADNPHKEIFLCGDCPDFRTEKLEEWVAHTNAHALCEDCQGPQPHEVCGNHPDTCQCCYETMLNL